MILLIFLALSFFAGCAATPAVMQDPVAYDVYSPYDFKHPDAAVFADSIGKAIGTLDTISVDEIREVSVHFKALPRHEISREALFELKFLYEHWRHAVQADLLEDAARSDSLAELARVILRLSSLELAVNKEDLAFIGTALAKNEDDAEYQKALEQCISLVVM